MRRDSICTYASVFISSEMLVIKCASVFLLFCLLKTNVYGFFRNCHHNLTLFVQEGSKATLSAADISSVYMAYVIKYNKTSSYYIYRSYLRNFDFTQDLSDLTDDVHFYYPRMKNKTEVKAGNMRLITVIHDIERTDNGTYVLRLNYLYEYFCFALFVMGIYRQPEGHIEEHSPAYFYGYPKASEIRRPFANATMMWLVDGRNVSQDPQLVIQDGLIWIGSVSRTLNGKNITYRAVQDTGLTNETNFTVQVTYGPEAPLHFSPNKVHYFLNSGEAMPDISCSVDCNPPCTVSWDRLGNGHILRLEKVSSETTGEYVCTATRPGVDIVVNRSLIVHVADNSAFTIAIALLASIQTVTTIILGLCGVFIYRRRGPLPWPCLKTPSSRPTDVSTTESGIENNSYETEMEHYEVLDSESRNVTPAKHYEDVQPKESSSEQHLELYVNTNIASNRL